MFIKAGRFIRTDIVLTKASNLIGVGWSWSPPYGNPRGVTIIAISQMTATPPSTDKSLLILLQI